MGSLQHIPQRNSMEKKFFNFQIVNLSMATLGRMKIFCNGVFILLSYFMENTPSIFNLP